jgi:hypothetical protein
MVGVLMGSHVGDGVRCGIRTITFYFLRAETVMGLCLPTTG